MRLMHLLAAAVAVAMAGPFTSAETVCRPTELGTLRCVGPAVRPEPRPILRPTAPTADRSADEPDDRFVPARETDRLGGATITDRPVSGPCRPDRLGNLHCR
jgi:hypothetical protein